MMEEDTEVGCGLTWSFTVVVIAYGGWRAEAAFADPVIMSVIECWQNARYGP